MTLIEAIKSGQEFRRKGWNISPDYWWTNARAHAVSWTVTPDDILADDWEIKEPKVEITRAQFLQAFGQMYCQPPWDRREVDSSFGIELAQLLGLGEAP